jgi:hypothetical protein
MDFTLYTFCLLKMSKPGNNHRYMKLKGDFSLPFFEHNTHNIIQGDDRECILTHKTLPLVKIKVQDET